MKKLLSCLLSATLICTSVTPSLAAPDGRKFLQGMRAGFSKEGVRKFAQGTGALSERTLLQGMRTSFPLQHTALLSKVSSISLSRQILTHANIAERTLLLRSDFPILALNRQTSPEELHQAVQFYRAQLTGADQLFAQLPATSTLTGAQEKQIAGTVADIASLGLFGLPSRDVPLISQVYEKSIGTAAEPFITAVSARALLRLQAYDALETMSAKSTQQPELWDGISSYAQANNLPIKIASVQRQAVDVKPLHTSLQDFGALNTLAVNPSAASTYLYMNAGKNVPSTAKQVASASTQSAGAQGVKQATTNPAELAEGVAPTTQDFGVPTSEAGTQPVSPAEPNMHAFRDQGLASAGMEATFPVYWEDKITGKTLDVTFQFENEAAKKAFYERVDLTPDEYFVFDRGTGGIVIRKEMTAEERASEAKPKERGFFKVFFEGGQKTPLALYKVLFSREMLPAFESAQELPEVMTLLSTYRADLKQILSADLLAKHPTLKNYLGAKDSVLDKATIDLLETNQVLEMAQDIAAELKGILATNAGTPIKVFKDDIGHWAQNFAGFAEGTFGTMGQANTSALGLLGITKGSLSNLPTTAGQFGPAWAPFIGAWADKYGTKKMLNIGQILGAGGHLGAALSLALGAMGVLPPLEAFAGMVGGITANGVAGSIMKQINPMIAKQRTSDPVSSSATITDLNAWASAGGMYCYLFLPVVGALSWLATGSMDATLATLSAMFGVASAIPITANVLLRRSRIQNITKESHAQKGIFKTIGENLKFGFKSPFLLKMFAATAGGHFMGLGFNSGPGHFIKENIANPSVAMAVSFLSVYLTVFAGRKLGAKAMQKGFIGDRALAGLSGLIGVSMGAASLIPGLDFTTRCAFFALAGLGFSNWVNVLQSIELSRPENIGRESAVSSMYILARTSGMLTMLMGMFGDQLGASFGLSSTDAALYALTMPLAAGLGSMLLNRQYITKDLWPTAKRWGISLRNWAKKKLGLPNNTGATPEAGEAPLDAAQAPAQ